MGINMFQTKKLYASSSSFLGLTLFLGLIAPSFAGSTTWGPWNNFKNLSGLQYSVKCNGYNSYAKKYDWSVRFKNNYTKPIHFSRIAVNPTTTSARTDSRFDIKPGRVDQSWWLIKNAPCGGEIGVQVDRVRFGNDSGPYLKF